jgi:N-acetylmuramoyl-L-alanine amidase
LAQLAGKVVALDPGHGGSDTGARSRDGQTVEKFVTLEVAQRLRRLLADAGARVVPTRTQDARPMAPGARDAPADERQDLEARVQIGNAAGADLFVSLHADALADPERGGALVFWGPATGYTYPDERPEELVRSSREAARTLLWHLVARTGVVERGAAAEAFYVLGRTRMPAVLVEMAVLTNPAEGVFLTGEGFQQRVAEGLFDGIADYFGDRDDAAFVADVTVPDGAIVRPETALTKVWRLRNTGRSTWTPAYRLAFYAGDRLDGPADVALPQAVAPGATLEVGATLRTPPGDRGWLFSQWRLRTPSGMWFGPVFWVLVMSRGPRPTDPAEPRAGALYFAETGHNVGGAFRRFFEDAGAFVAANGGAAAPVAGAIRLFGYPRTEEVQENGLTVQYFQRARLEWRSDRAGGGEEVQLAPLVTALTAGQRPFAGVPDGGTSPPGSDADVRVLPDPEQPGVGHTLRGEFRRFYETFGGERLFGLPLSEEVPWNDPGAPPERTRPVQLFERAQFEYLAEQAGTPDAVQLALAGDEFLRRRGWLDPPSPIGRIG